MRKQLTIIAALAALGGVARAEPGAGAPDAAPLELNALYVQRGTSLVFSPEAEELRGRLVRVRGYMVHTEDGPRGAFHLARRPVEQDESGGGTGDIPVDSVLVVVPGTSAHEIPWRSTPVEVVGTLEIGRKEDADGRISSVRVIMADLAAP